MLRDRPPLQKQQVKGEDVSNFHRLRRPHTRASPSTAAASPTTSIARAIGVIMKLAYK
jgi:hypothetical protein